MQIIPYWLRFYRTRKRQRTCLESTRWASGRFCTSAAAWKHYRLHVKKIKRRRYKCSPCQKQFTVSVGTVMEDSHIPFGKWIYAIYQMCIAKKGVSALQLSRELGLGYKSAWFMCHRIRHAMTQAPLAQMLSGIVEMDETYVGGKQLGPEERRPQPEDEDPGSLARGARRQRQELRRAGRQGPHAQGAGL